MCQYFYQVKWGGGIKEGNVAGNMLLMQLLVFAIGPNTSQLDGRHSVLIIWIVHGMFWQCFLRWPVTALYIALKSSACLHYFIRVGDILALGVFSSS